MSIDGRDASRCLNDEIMKQNAKLNSHTGLGMTHLDVLYVWFDFCVNFYGIRYIIA